jgi:hypothetical protein
MTGRKLCPTCGSDHVIHVVDRDLDCVTGFKCEWCGAEWMRPLAEVLAVADPAAFDDPVVSLADIDPMHAPGFGKGETR